MEGIPEQDMIDHELRIQANNQNGNKKAKSTGTGQYGELSLEQLQQQLAAHKAAASAPSNTVPSTLTAAGSTITPAVSATAVVPPIAYPPPPPPPVVAQAAPYYGYVQPTPGYVGYQAAYNNQYYPPQQPSGYPSQSFGYNSNRPPTG